MNTSVKLFHSDMPGAPVLGGVAGSVIAVLDAVLKDGIGLQAVSAASVADGVVTLTVPAGHSFEPETVALIAGAVTTAVNTEHRITSTASTWVKFPAPAGVPDGPLSGSITAKLAPLGWDKVFSATNTGAYRSRNPEGTRMFLRVLDSDTLNARVVGYESMTDANTGLGMFPTNALVAGGGYWPKANAANATARPWTLVGDDRSFYLHIHTLAGGGGVSGSVFGFGDFASTKQGDAYGCALFSAYSAIHSTAAPQASTAPTLEYVNTGVASFAHVPRSFSAIGGGLTIQHHAEIPNIANSATAVSGNGAGGTVYPVYPNPADNGLHLAKKILVEPGVTMRGRTRGLYLTGQNCHNAFSWRDRVDGQGDVVGRKLVAIKCGSPAGAVSQGVVFLDITGPWG